MVHAMRSCLKDEEVEVGVFLPPWTPSHPSALTTRTPHKRLLYTPAPLCPFRYVQPTANRSS